MTAVVTRCGEFRRPDDPAYGRTHGTPQTPFSWPWRDSRTEAHRDEAPTTTPHPLTFTARKRTGMLLLRNAGEAAANRRESAAFMGPGGRKNEPSQGVPAVYRVGTPSPGRGKIQPLPIGNYSEYDA